MKLSMGYIILYVQDFEKAMHFYKEILHLPIKMQQHTYVEFDTGHTILSINTRKDVRALTGLNISEPTTSQSFEIGFVVEDVHETINILRGKGVKILIDPVTKPWGQTVAYIADPDGHYIEICTSID